MRCFTFMKCLENSTSAGAAKTGFAPRTTSVSTRPAFMSSTSSSSERVWSTGLASTGSV